MKKVLFISFIVIFLFAFSYAGEYGGLPGEYLFSFSANARALGMGRSYTAIAFDSSAGYWNPAGLARMKYREGSFLYAPLFEDTAYYFLGIGYPISEGNVVGLSIGNLRVDGVENTLYNREFGESQAAYIFSYAHSYKDIIDLGVNLKVVSHNMDIYSASGFGIDIGGIYEIKESFIGACIQNLIRPSLKLNNEKDTFPLNLKLGLGRKFYQEKITGSVDFDIINIFGPSVHPFKWHIGIEYNPYDFFSVRGGLDYKEITFGLGFKNENLSFDYAAGYHALGLTHRISISSRFGLIPSEVEKVIEKNKREAEINIHYSNGLRAFNKKDFQKAEYELRQVLELEPDNKDARKLINRVIVSQQNKEARNFYIKALDEKDKGREEKAQDLINQAKVLDREVDEKLQEEYFIKAHRYIRYKEYKKAEKELEKVVQINPDNEEARELLGRIKSIIEFTE